MLTRRKFLTTLGVILALAFTSGGIAGATANEAAPCLGQNASTFAPAFGRDFAQVVVIPVALAGETGEVVSTAARTDC